METREPGRPDNIRLEWMLTIAGAVLGAGIGVIFFDSAFPEIGFGMLAAWLVSYSVKAVRRRRRPAAD